MGTEIVQSRYQVLSTPPNGIQGDPQEGLFAPTVDQRYRLGTKLWDARGRTWRYIKNAATQLEVGLMAQCAAPEAETIDEIQTGYTTAIGDTTIEALLTTSSELSDGELSDGWLVVNKATGLGYSYPIKWNVWTTGDTVMSLELYEAIRVATSATSEFTFVKNKFSDCVVMPTTPTSIAAGIPNVVIPASYYGWVQTKGYCAAIVDTSETLVIGCAVGFPAASAVAGAVGVFAATGPYFGTTVTIGVAAEAATIDLALE